MAKQIQKRPNVYQSEFVQALAQSAKISEISAQLLTEKFLQTLTETLLEKQSICFPEFGVFELRETPERVGRNLRTMEECTIPAGFKPVFRPSRILRDFLNKSAQDKEAENEDLSLQESDEGSITA